MRQTRSQIRSVQQTEADGVVYQKGDAVLLKDDEIGIISQVLVSKDDVSVSIHGFTTQDLLERMEFRKRKLDAKLDKKELLYNTGGSRTVSLQEIVEKVDVFNEKSNGYYCYRALDIERGNIFSVDWDVVKQGQDLFTESSPKKDVQRKVGVEDETLINSSEGEGVDSGASDFDVVEAEQEENDDLELDVVESESSEESMDSDFSDGDLEISKNSKNDIYYRNKKGPVKKRKTGKFSGLDSVRAAARPVLRNSKKFTVNDIQRTIPPNATIYQKARDRLYLSHTPDSLPCREREFDEIYLFVEGLIKAKSGACIYISGVPGTGKTATVLSVINAIQKQMIDKKFPYCEVIEINGMKLTEPAQAYQELWAGLSGKKVSSSHALELLTERFSKSTSNDAPCIVIMDELDLLLTKNQKVIYNFFDWPNKPNSRLIVLAIANTMDLPERTLSNKVASRLEMKRITFQPYSYQQLVEIVKSRLESFDVFSPDAIQFCARKVASVSGDARRALAICRRAIELLEESSLTLKKETISLDLIQRVITEMYSGPGVQSVRKASLHQRIFLVSIFRASRINGKPEVEFSDVCHEHHRICQLKGIFTPTNRELVAVACFMSSSHLIHCETNKMGDPNQKMRLIVIEDDLMTALRTDKENEFLHQIVEA